jgi:hypothetical protein
VAVDVFFPVENPYSRRRGVTLTKDWGGCSPSTACTARVHLDILSFLRCKQEEHSASVCKPFYPCKYIFADSQVVCNGAA